MLMERLGNDDDTEFIFSLSEFAFFALFRAGWMFYEHRMDLEWLSF